MYIKRNLEKQLEEWRVRSNRKPLIIRGARQVGKSRLVAEFGEERFTNAVVVNLEKERRLRELFERNDDVKRMVGEIEIAKNARIEPGRTLLFIDEIQECPAAITKLRYFYEDLPGLHVVAAGSLLEFTLEREALSFPVGRVEFLYLFPLSFIEFLGGAGEGLLLEYLNGVARDQPIPPALHEKARAFLRDYMLVGGMPEASAEFIESRRYADCARMMESIIETYREDFKKYSPRANTGNLEFIFSRLPRVAGQQINLTKLGEGELRPREAAAALEMLEKAMIAFRVKRLKSVSFPMAPSHGKRHKLVFMDLGLVQHMNRISDEIVHSENFSNIYKGAFAEQYVGQQLIPLVGSTTRPELFYWHRDEPKRGMAEVDFILPIGSRLIPLEVKAGRGSKLASLRQFLLEHPLPLAVRIYDGPLQSEKITAGSPRSGAKIECTLLSIPLYLVHRLPDLCA